MLRKVTTGEPGYKVNSEWLRTGYKSRLIASSAEALDPVPRMHVAWCTAFIFLTDITLVIVEMYQNQHTSI
jgi:hypothetical protein